MKLFASLEPLFAVEFFCIVISHKLLQLVLRVPYVFQVLEILSRLSILMEISGNIFWLRRASKCRILFLFLMFSLLDRAFKGWKNFPNNSFDDWQTDELREHVKHPEKDDICEQIAKFIGLVINDQRPAWFD